jgi:6-phosphogluconolactonase
MPPILLASTLLCLPARPASGSGQDWLVYIGTYTDGKSKGIYCCRFDGKEGRLSEPQLVAESLNPTFLAVHPDGKHLYAANETGQFAGRKTGAITAYAIDGGSGKLTNLGQASSGGPGPCHVVVHPSGRQVLAANYGGGSVAMLALDAEGRVSDPGVLLQHTGSSVNPRRQEGPHAHGIAFDAKGRFALVADLGLDKIQVYRCDPALGTLTAHEPPFASVAPGAGPRHLAFHPNGRFLYVINEMGSTVTAFAYAAATGTLREVGTVRTLPEGYAGSSTTAEIAIHPSGKFLYGSNRGHDSIAMFAVDPTSGLLRSLGHQSTLGRTPRNFNLDPTGTWLLAANQSSDTVVVFRVDPKSGLLSPSGQTVAVGAPVCIQFVRPQ